MNIKAIETIYNGYKFRSRCEARWAVFFDALGIKYEFEPQGFELESGRYLPDFWLPNGLFCEPCYAEVKKYQGDEYFDVAERFPRLNELSHHKPCLLLDGDPDFVNYYTSINAYGSNFCCDIILFWKAGIEGRWYFGTEWEYNSRAEVKIEDCSLWDKRYIEAVHASRSARFEFGETPEQYTDKPTYTYCDENNNTLFQKIKVGPNKWLTRKPNGSGGWIYNTSGIRKVLYRLPQVIHEAQSGGNIAIVNGEEKVHEMEQKGYVATCKPNGHMSPWLPEYSQALQGASSVQIITNPNELPRWVKT